MKGSIDLFKTDRDLEASGVWVTIEHGVRLRVARMNNPEYLAYLRMLMTPHRQAIRSAGRRYKKDGEDKAFAELSEDLLEELTAKAMARHILLGWEELYEPELDEDGDPVLDDDDNPKLVAVPYSVEKAEEFLTTYREFYLIVMEVSNDESLYREQVQKDSEEN
jgi:hypothetical protein